ncbi:substrate-binding domain-containing protein [Kitasatospora phosalacinea]|uniref:substrate-binding domain-containing protein n=1 Tax=Kitasatospora phosalacinea TaxID=2065 RepID=UPI0005277332|nr:substrate-binding domain-containing protein [Kitasatospora phosalacinea]
MTERRQFAAQRQERVMDELRRHGAVRVRELAQLLGVSELTVRRDLAALAARALLTQVHGGAVLPVENGAVPARRQRPVPAGTPYVIGMVVPSLDYYWPQVVGGARTAAAALGVQLQLRGSSYDVDEDRRQITRLVAAQQVQGLLLAPNLDGEGVEEMIDWIGKLPVPVVLVERQTPHWTPTPQQLEWVRSDHALGLEMALRHLHEHGHRRIGLVLSKGSPTSAHLAHGWERTCADLGLPDDFVVRDNVTLEQPGHRESIERLLGGARERGVTALIVHSDPSAIAIAQYFAEVGVSVPDDVALVSYDDEVAHLAHPAITAVRPPKARVGREAVEMLVARIVEGRRRPPRRVLILPELFIRGSSVKQPEHRGAATPSLELP